MSYTCPVCGAVSQHPDDEREGYCGRCHQFTPGAHTMRYGDNDIGVAMQTRCVHCLAEQYALNVIDVSYGEAGCAWCGAQSRLMTHEEYRQALTEAKEARTLREAATIQPPRERE